MTKYLESSSFVRFWPFFPALDSPVVICTLQRIFARLRGHSAWSVRYKRSGTIRFRSFLPTAAQLVFDFLWPSLPPRRSFSSRPPTCVQHQSYNPRTRDLGLSSSSSLPLAASQSVTWWAFRFEPTPQAGKFSSSGLKSRSGCSSTCCWRTRWSLKSKNWGFLCFLRYFFRWMISMELLLYLRLKAFQMPITS